MFNRHLEALRCLVHVIHYGRQPDAFARLDETARVCLSRRLSVEGTNPMAKEFTPSMGPIAPEVAVDVQSGETYI